MKPLCVGREIPTEQEVEADWVCECGHDFDSHDFNFDGAMSAKPGTFWLKIETCGGCEHMPRLLRLAAEPLDREPEPPKVLPGQRRLFE